MVLMAWGKYLSIMKSTKLGFPPRPTDMFFFYFKCSVSVGDQEYEVFEESEPNSVRSNKPLLQSICDEDNTASLSALLPLRRKEIR